METFSKKICLLGDFAVGKTSLVRRFVHNRFDDQYISTIGVKVSRKSIIVPVDEKIVEVRLMVWDLAGSQEFTAVSASYLRGASGAIIVCDMTRAETVARLRTYADDLHRVMPQAHIVIAANKMDLTDQFQVTEADIAEQASALNTSYFQTSAKIGDDVDHAFRCLSVLLLKH